MWILSLTKNVFYKDICFVFAQSITLETSPKQILAIFPKVQELKGLMAA